MTSQERAERIIRRCDGGETDEKTLEDIRAGFAAEIDAAVAEEREACAKAVESIHADPERGHDSWEWCPCEETAAAIRARK